jgi:hypothetical protein
MIDACKATTKQREQCTRPATQKSGYCKQHCKDHLIEMYRKELKKMHERVRKYCTITNNLNNQLKDIQYLDWLKANLMDIGGGNRSFRSIIKDPYHADQVEQLFEKPYPETLTIYNDLLERRNKIVHRYTLTTW